MAKERRHSKKETAKSLQLTRNLTDFGHGSYENRLNSVRLMEIRVKEKYIPNGIHPIITTDQSKMKGNCHQLSFRNSALKYRQIKIVVANHLHIIENKQTAHLSWKTTNFACVLNSRDAMNMYSHPIFILSFWVLCHILTFGSQEMFRNAGLASAACRKTIEHVLTSCSRFCHHSISNENSPKPFFHRSCFVELNAWDSVVVAFLRGIFFCNWLDFTHLFFRTTIFLCHIFRILNFFCGFSDKCASNTLWDRFFALTTIFPALGKMLTVGKWVFFFLTTNCVHRFHSTTPISTLKLSTRTFLWIVLLSIHDTILCFRNFIKSLVHSTKFFSVSSESQETISFRPQKSESELITKFFLFTLFQSC